MSILLLAYISDATREYSEAEMEELLKVCRRNNQKINVTGMLLYAGNKFLQILEGEPAIVQDLYAKLETDDRHKNAVVMDTQLANKRNFVGWSMGYERASAREMADELDGYLNAFEDGELDVGAQPIKNLSITILLNAFKRVIESKKAAA